METMLEYYQGFISSNKICYYNAGQSILAKTSNCIFLSRKGDFSELPPSPNFIVVLKVFVCERATTSILIVGWGRGHNVREEDFQDSINSN